MNLKPASQYSGTLPIFCRVFPFKVKYLGLAPPPSHHFGLRGLSTRSSRPRPSSTSGFKGEVQASKSLIEDEAELSDWVSGLKDESFHNCFNDGESEGERGRVVCARKHGLIDGEKGGFDSLVSSTEDRSDGSAELMVLNPRAILPCFVIIYNVGR